MGQPFEALMTFVERGGPVFVAILFLSVVMWTLILERYWYYRRALKSLRARYLSPLDAGGNRRPPPGLQESLASGFRLRVTHFLPSIRTLTAILPALGLLGTVSGMIATFDSIAVFGSQNVRGMASGISQALATTLAGLVTALSGLYFSADLESRARREIEHFENLLRRQ